MRVFTNIEILELKSLSRIIRGLKMPFRKKTAVSLSKHYVRRGKLTSCIIFGLISNLMH